MMVNFLRRGRGRTLQEEGLLLVLATAGLVSNVYVRTFGCALPKSHTYSAGPLAASLQPWSDTVFWLPLAYSLECCFLLFLALTMATTQSAATFPLQ